MGWRDNMQPASFKGAIFYVDGTLYQKGRRVATRKLAGGGSRNTDLGADDDEVDVNAYLFGEDYDLLRDELEEKLTEPGPGPLVLPLRGDRWARIVRGPSTSEDKDRGGICLIRFTAIIEDRTSGTLRARPDTSRSVTTAASSVRVIGKREFETVYSAKGLPDRYTRGAARALDAATATLRSIQSATAPALATISTATASLTELNNALATVLSTPADLVTHIVDAVNGVLALGDTTKAGIDRLTGLPSVLKGPFERAQSTRETARMHAQLAALSEPAAAAAGATELGTRAADNARAINRAVRAAALARAAETYATAPFDSATLAVGVLDAMTAEIDAVQKMTTSDEAWQALADLRAALAAHLTETSAQLPLVVRQLVRDPMPALLLAHELYGDARRNDDIVARNPDLDPSALVGLVEVLAS